MHNASLALFYALKLALVGGNVYEWQGEAPPRLALQGAVHVAVDATHGYAIDNIGRAVRWKAGGAQPEVLLDRVTGLAAGESGLLAIRSDGSLWQRTTADPSWQRIAAYATHAWVGDSSNYYIDAHGGLFASGAAHRGQYGNGQLTDAKGWVKVADGAMTVCAHTGHAVYLGTDGRVRGTGGNRFGPLGPHGYGDKADRWGEIFAQALSVATGSRHTVAIRADGSLWSWGAADGLAPRQVMADVAAAAAGDTETLARKRDGSLWQWTVGQSPRQVHLP